MKKMKKKRLQTVLSILLAFSLLTGHDARIFADEADDGGSGSRILSADEAGKEEVSEDEAYPAEISTNEAEAVSGNGTLSQDETEASGEEPSAGTPSVNALPAPKSLTAEMNEKNWVHLSWDKVNTYKDPHRTDSGNEAYYILSRYEGDGVWKEIYRDTETEFVDKTAGLDEGKSYIYKVNVLGRDQELHYGGPEWGTYQICRPVLLSVGSRDGEALGLNVKMLKMKGADAYKVQKAEGEPKNFADLALSVKDVPYYGDKVVSANSFKEDGSLKIPGVKNPVAAVGISDNEVKENVYYHYRVLISAEVTDSVSSGNGKKTVSQISLSAGSAPVEGKTTVGAPGPIRAIATGYNEVWLVFEKSEKVETGDENDQYQIYRSTEAGNGYEFLRRITGRDLAEAGEEDDLIRTYGPEDEIVIGGSRVIHNRACIAYRITGHEPEKTYYYRTRAVQDTAAGPLSEAYVSATPRMDDVKRISANSTNFDRIKVSVEPETKGARPIAGARQMVIYYRALGLMDSEGKDIRPGGAIDPSSEEGKLRSKVFEIKYDSKKKSYTKDFLITGLKHGYRYEFYAQPKNKTEHITAEPVKVMEYPKAAAPALTVKATGLRKIHVVVKPVSQAVKYEVRVRDRKGTLLGTYVMKKLTDDYVGGDIPWKSGSGTYQLEPGVDYSFEARAYRTDANFPKASPLGGSWSAEKTAHGQPRAVLSPKAEYHALVGGKSADAMLSWKVPAGRVDNKEYDTSVTAEDRTKLCYAITRAVYPYTGGDSHQSRPSSLDIPVLAKENGNQVLTYNGQSGPMQTEAQKYFSDGAKVVYTITSYYLSTDKSLGDNGYIKGDSKTVTYITPYKIAITGPDAVGVNASINLSVRYYPKNVTVKGISDWSIENGSEYISLNNKGKVTGKKTTPKNTPAKVSATTKNGKTAYKTIRVTTNSKDLTVCIDAGHGGNDSGATYNGLKEKDCNLAIANAAKSRLESQGVGVVMTRSGDVYIGLDDRPKKAADSGCSLFVSIHCNSGGGSGTEVWQSIYSEYRDDALSQKILQKICGRVGTNSRGVKTRSGDHGDYYAVIRGSANRGLKGIIVETAFMQNDYGKLSNASTREEIGKAIADGILERYGY